MMFIETNSITYIHMYTTTLHYSQSSLLLYMEKRHFSFDGRYTNVTITNTLHVLSQKEKDKEYQRKASYLINDNKNQIKSEPYIIYDCCLLLR